MTMLRRIGVLVACTLLPLLAACNTVEGVGRDVQATGKAIERTAR